MKKYLYINLQIYIFAARFQNRILGPLAQLVRAPDS